MNKYKVYIKDVNGVILSTTIVAPNIDKAILDGCIYYNVSRDNHYRTQLITPKQDQN